MSKAILMLVGMFMICTGVYGYAYVGQVVVERPYLVENEGIPQFHLVMDVYIPLTEFEEGMFYKYDGSIGINWVLQDNTISLMYALGENIVKQENKIWKWCLENARYGMIVADVKNIDVKPIRSNVINTFEIENVIINGEPSNAIGKIDFVYPAYRFGELSIFENCELGIYGLLYNPENEEERDELVLALNPSARSLLYGDKYIKADVVDISYKVVKDVGRRKLINFDFLVVVENNFSLNGHGIIVTPNLYLSWVEILRNKFWLMLILIGVLVVVIGTIPSDTYRIYR